MLVIPFLDLIDNEEDKNKYSQIYEKYRNLLLRVSYDKIHDYQLAEDNVQETFYQIALNFEKVSAVGEVGSIELRAYICCIARNIAINKFKQITRHPEASLDDEPVRQSSYSNVLENENKIILKNAIDKLPEDYKSVIQLCEGMGYTSKEAAKILNMTPANVRKKLQFARAKLREIIGDLYE